jgi:hypothetical protein
MRLPKLPDYYVPSIYNEISALGGGAFGFATQTYPAANRAIYVPIIFPYPAQLYSMSMIATNATGNWDIGLYDGYTKLLMASKGSTAMASGIKTLTFSPEIRVEPGRLYYAGVSLSSTSGSIVRSNPGIPACVAAGMGQEASALPLPASMTPAIVASTYVPLFIFGVR